MRESRADTAQAVLFALLLHGAMFVLLFLSLWWTRENAPLSAAGSPVSAEVVDFSELSSSMQRTLAQEPEPLPEPVAEPEPVPEEAAPPPQPLPAPLPEEAVVEPQPQVQERIPEPDPIDQEAVRRDAEAERARVEREQEEKRRQEQIDLTERQRQEEAEQKRRLAQQQLEKIRAERERAAREARLAEEKLKQLADREARQASDQASPAPPPPGNQGVDSGLSARYAAALQEAIRRNWTRPDNVPLGQRCRIYITQLPGGEVMNVDFDPSCPYDALGRRSVEAAVRKAEPLPYAGFEAVFSRRLNLNFEAQDR